MLAKTTGLGLTFEPTDAICVNGEANGLTKHQVVMIDHAQTTATDNQQNSPNGIYATVVDPITAANGYGIFGVCLEDIAQNENGRVRFRGQVRVEVNANTDRGDGLSTLSTNRLDATPTTNNTIVAIAEEANTAGAGGVIWVLFNGVEKLGIETS